MARATLGLNHRQGMSVRIPDQQSLREPERPVCESHHGRRKRVARAATNRSRQRFGIVADQDRLAVCEIVGAGIGRHRPPVPWGQIFEELDTGTRGSPERRDAQTCAKDVVQALLLGPVILTLTSHAKAERVPITAKALSGVADDNCRVIDTKEKPVARSVPSLISLAYGKPQDLERMAVRVLEVERADPARIQVPIREALRRRRGVLDAMLSEPRVGTIHVAHDDRDVLKPTIVTA